MTPAQLLREFLHTLPAGMKLRLENGDELVVLMPKRGTGFHDWHYYLLDGPKKGLRVVRRHRVLPELFPTREIIVDAAEGKARQIVEVVAQKINEGMLEAMGDCSA